MPCFPAPRGRPGGGPARRCVTAPFVTSHARWTRRAARSTAPMCATRTPTSRSCASSTHSASPCCWGTSAPTSWSSAIARAGPTADGACGSGADATASRTRTSAPVLAPIRSAGNQLAFRVKLVDQHEKVCFLAYRSGRAIATDPGWEITPSALVTPEVRVDLTRRTILDAEEQQVPARQLRGTQSADGDHRARRGGGRNRRGRGGARQVGDADTDDVPCPAAPDALRRWFRPTGSVRSVRWRCSS